MVDSRSSGSSIRRRRECLGCNRRFTTYEYVEVIPLTVIKRDHTREPFSRQKMLSGILTACKKRPISTETIEQIATRIENKLMHSDSQEVGYDQIGNYIMDELREIDAVAYVRFASVYREFKEVDEFLQQVIDLQKKDS